MIKVNFASVPFLLRHYLPTNAVAPSRPKAVLGVGAEVGRNGGPGITPEIFK